MVSLRSFSLQDDRNAPKPTRRATYFFASLLGPAFPAWSQPTPLVLRNEVSGHKTLVLAAIFVALQRPFRQFPHPTGLGVFRSEFAGQSGFNALQQTRTS